MTARARGQRVQRARSLGFDSYLVALNAALRWPGHAFRLGLLRRVGRVSVGERSSVERSVRLTTKGGVRIGDATNINRDVLLDGRGGLTIGDRVNISSGVQLFSAEHDPGSPTFEGRERAVVVGDRAWLASRAILLPGTQIGEGAIVGAGAVVRGHVEPFTIVAGNPAVVIGHRSPDAQTELARYRRFLH